MNCPNCKIPLVMSDRQGIEIDYCPECRGIWLDRGELDKIIERSVNEQPNNFQPNQQPFGNQPQQGKEYRKKHWLNDLFD
ncbi:MAG: zf-TFIIB domain-containing protein [Lutibacter sp.]|nr:zf-TFIIB domain-containing protein [Lutibacter sp.]